MASEFDRYMTLQRGMSPGQTFAQMMQSMKNGLGQGGSGNGMAGMAGGSATGSSGGSPNPGSTFDMLGGEPDLAGSDGGKRSEQGEGSAKNPKELLSEHSKAHDQGDAGDRDAVIAGSDAVQSDTLIEQYRGITDAYFDSLTTRREAPAAQESAKEETE